MSLSWGRATGIVVGAVLVGWACTLLPGRPIVNTSPSEPYGLYWVSFFPKKIPPLRLGERVLFHYRAPRWALGRYEATGAKFLKQIGAIPGEWLFTKGLAQWACPTDSFQLARCTKLGVIMRKDPKGRPMHWPVWKGYRIPPGEYYMQATYVPISYDSRYYGLVQNSQLIGRLTPLYLFGR